MKKYLSLLLIVTSLTVNAQDDVDYSFLITDADYFEIGQKKTKLTDSADIQNYKIEVTPKKEEYTYLVDGIKTPRAGLFGKKKNFKLVVDREQGKITRVTSRNFVTSDKSDKDEHELTSATVLPNGRVKSFTKCDQSFKNGFLKIMSNKDEATCVTVNDDACLYLDQNKEIDDLTVEASKCAATMKSLADHQVQLKKLLKKDAEADMDAIKKLDNLGNFQKYFDIETSTIKGISLTYTSFSKARKQCDTLIKYGHLNKFEHLRGKKIKDKDATTGQ
jgi:hypothetical protein